MSKTNSSRSCKSKSHDGVQSSGHIILLLFVPTGNRDKLNSKSLPMPLVLDHQDLVARVAEVEVNISPIQTVVRTDLMGLLRRCFSFQEVFAVEAEVPGVAEEVQLDQGLGPRVPPLRLLQRQTEQSLLRLMPSLKQTT